MADTKQTLVVAAAIALLAMPLPATSAPSAGGGRIVSGGTAKGPIVQGGRSSKGPIVQGRGIKTPPRLRRTPMQVVAFRKASSRYRYKRASDQRNDEWQEFRFRLEQEILRANIREQRRKEAEYRRMRIATRPSLRSDVPGLGYGEAGFRCLPKDSTELWKVFHQRCLVNSGETPTHTAFINRGCALAQDETVKSFTQRCTFRFEP